VPVALWFKGTALPLLLLSVQLRVSGHHDTQPALDQGIGISSNSWDVLMVHQLVVN
jgi:hypothetical protein